MNLSTTAQNINPARQSLACIRCSERKVRCDKQQPCNACVRHNVECIVSPPKAASRRKREVVRDKLIDERLKFYERLLREKGVDLNQLNGTPEAGRAENHDTGSHSVSENVWQLPTQSTIFKAQLRYAQGGTELVDNSLWSRVAEEITDIEDQELLGEDIANDETDNETSNDDFSYLLSWKTPAATPHPPTDLIRRLWQIFVENVNPLTKLVHVPSLQSALEKAIVNIERIPRGFQALMFAIYSMAVLSLTEDECNEILGESRAILLPHYVAATRSALSRANFMSSTSVVVLQALVLHIHSIRDDSEPRAIWNLTGLAIRVADSIGLGIDGALLGLSPFESEIRRRIWWQLRLHDFRAAELCGQAKFRDFKLDETTPKKPANVNDSSLYPMMPHAPIESAKPAEMIWCMFRSELASFAASQISRMRKEGQPVHKSPEYSAMNDSKIKEIFVKELEEMIETKYLRFCDPSQPLQLWTLIGARSASDIFQFMAHHPRKWASLDQVPESEKQLVWDIVIQLLERYKMLYSTPQLQRFAWNTPYFIHWHAVIHVLDTLRANPLHQDAVKAWGLVDSLFENNLEMMLGIKKPVIVAVGSLCLKAFSSRLAALERENCGILKQPQYITKLRQEREVAKARREELIVRRNGQKTFGDQQNPPMDGSRPDTTQNLANTLLNDKKAQYQGENSVQGGTRTEDDAFWLNDDLVSGLLGEASDIMNIDSDTILTQGWIETSNNDMIDWVKWDSWLGNPGSTRSSNGPGLG